MEDVQFEQVLSIARYEELYGKVKIDVPDTSCGNLQTCMHCPYHRCRFQGKRMFGFSHNCSDVMKLFDLMREISIARKKQDYEDKVMERIKMRMLEKDD